MEHMQMMAESIIKILAIHKNFWALIVKIVL